MTDALTDPRVGSLELHSTMPFHPVVDPCAPVSSLDAAGDDAAASRAAALVDALRRARKAIELAARSSPTRRTASSVASARTSRAARSRSR